jgi:hypothetical protein
MVALVPYLYRSGHSVKNGVCQATEKWVSFDERGRELGKVLQSAALMAVLLCDSA